MLAWAKHYRKDYLSGDISAGVIVGLMLVPQAMAYAMLAGMPPVTGLYACIAPILIYALFGSSNYMAIGPVAVVSLMVANISGELAVPGSAEYQSIAVLLAMLSGVAMIIFALLRFGVLVNFLSHSVIVGFINAASLLIAASQLRHLLGLDTERSNSFFQTIKLIFLSIDQINIATLLISVIAFLMLIASGKPLEKWMINKSFSKLMVSVVTKTGPLIIVVLGCLITWMLSLDVNNGVDIVGFVPPGLPPFTIPAFDLELWQDLLPAALLITFVCYLESISIARSLASKRKERVKSNQELFAIGAANIASAFSASFCVGGGFGRSGVNFSAGANTQMASLVTALLIVCTLLFFSPLFYYLPVAVLAVIVFMAVLNLFDAQSIVKAWKFNRADAISSIITLFSVLAFGVEQGILIGITISLGLYLWRTSRPHIAIVGRVGDTEHFRNVERHKVRTSPHIIAVRIDESLYFANAHALEDKLLQMIASGEETRHVVLICSAINFIDFSALDILDGVREKLRDAGVLLHLAEVKGPVIDKLRETEFFKHLGEGNVYLSTHEAFNDLEEKDTYFQI
jgi:SulP family sulfate permease